MNQALETALTGLITKSVQGVETAGEFLIAEVPEVVQQLLLWYGVSSFITMIFPIVLLIFFLLLFKKAWYGVETWAEPNFKNLCVIIIGWCSFITAIVSICTLNLTWLKIWIAPKIWLLEYAVSLTKSVTG